MDYSKIAAVKKQRDALRMRIKTDINKLVELGDISNFQATHMVLDKLIYEADQTQKSYGFLKQDAWVGNLAETYLPSTTELVHGLAPKTETVIPTAGVQYPYTDAEAAGWESYTWGGYGPLTKEQFAECKAKDCGDGKTITLAKKYASYNKAYGFASTTKHVLMQPEEYLAWNDLPQDSPQTKVPGKPDNWSYTLEGDTPEDGWYPKYMGIKLGEYVDAAIVKKHGFHVCEKESHLVKLNYVPGVAAYKLIPKPKNDGQAFYGGHYVEHVKPPAGWSGTTADHHKGKLTPAKDVPIYNYGGPIKVSKGALDVHKSIYGSVDGTVKPNPGAFAKAVDAEMAEFTTQIINELEHPIGPKSKPDEYFPIFVYNKHGGGKYESVRVDWWYAGAYVANKLGGLKQLPDGYVKVKHQYKGLVKVIKEIPNPMPGPTTEKDDKTVPGWSWVE